MIKFIIERPVLVSMIIFGLCVLGVVSYNQLAVELIPFAELPMLIIQVGSVNDADPNYIEREGVIPLESVVASLEDIESIESFIDRRRATIFVYYIAGTDLKYAYLKLQEAVNGARETLGDNFFATVWKIDTEQLSNQFMTLQARGTGSLDQIRSVIDAKIVPELESIDGIANIEVYGGRRHSIEVIVDENALSANNITMGQISSAISGGSDDRQFLGQAVQGRRRYFVNLVSDYTSADMLADVVIKTEGPVLLKHVAEIIDGGYKEESISRINGMEAITISMVRDHQANLLDLSQRARKVIEKLNSITANDGVELVVQNDSAEVIEENIGMIKQLILIGGILAMVVLWIFLRSVPLVLIVVVTIPISILISINFFYAFGISINTLSLVGIAIAVGMLLDNSVVVLENIHRLRSRGKSVREAVISGASEVWRAVFAATLTTVAVFLPFVFSDNFLIQTLGRHVGISIISTLLVSLAMAFLLIPVFAYHFLSTKKQSETATFNVISQKNKLLRLYTVFLKLCLRHPAQTTIAGLVLFFASVIICLGLSLNISEEVELDNFNLYVTMPSGTTLATADEQVLEMDQRLSDIPEVAERRANISEDNTTISFQLVDDYKDVDGRSLAEIKTDILERLEGSYRRIDFSYQQPTSSAGFRGGGGGGGSRRGGDFARMLGVGASEEKVVVRGQDLELMRTVADDIKYNIDNLETVRRSNLSVTTQQPGIDLLFDRSALSYFDVSTNAIIAELAAFQEEQSSGAIMKIGDDEVDIIIRSKDTTSKTSQDLRTLQIPSSSGGIVPLTQLSRLLYTDGYTNIDRINQEKQIDITYRFESEVSSSSRFLEDARQGIDQIVAGIIPPPGISIEVVHDEADYSEFYFLIFAAIILIFMILASVFESPFTPLAMMFTIPLATIGAFWGLILTGNSIFNANALVGFLILLGVVVNNGIILLDYSRLLRLRGYRPSRAILEAGQSRVRPVLITTITTVLAMLPAAMGKAEYVAKIGAPFAISVIGGLITGTLFTLLLVPTVSFGMETVLRWWKKLSLTNRLAQAAALVGGMALIYFNVDGFLWQMADATILAMAVPGSVYFGMTSLRRSRETIIPAGVPITIEIRNVVKRYEDATRFVKEWRAALKDKNGTEQKPSGSRWTDAISAVWQLPLYLFLYYFAYLYLESGWWIYLFTILFYGYSCTLIGPLTKTSKSKLLRMAYHLIYWFGPAVNLVWYYLRWESLGWVITGGIFWYLFVLVIYGSKKLYREKIDINRLTGRLKRTRKNFYRLVKLIPIIGKRKVPFTALNGVTLEIQSGMFGLVGPNGAGKTTLMRIICGVFKQSYGKVRINGLDIDLKREELQSLIGYLPQEFGTYENMTAYQFLDYQAMLKGIWDPSKRNEVLNKVIKSVHLDESRHIKIKNFSGGMKQRVGIAQTLLHLPRILIVDEPTAGLDPRERIRFRNLLSELSRDRVVIFSTHIIEDVSSSCSRLAVLGEGKLKFLGAPAEMAEMARDHVWQVEIPHKEFEQVRRDHHVLHHISHGDYIRVRILSTDKPMDQAESVTPTLEDSYLWLLESHKKRL